MRKGYKLFWFYLLQYGFIWFVKVFGNEKRLKRGKFIFFFWANYYIIAKQFSVPFLQSNFPTCNR